MGKISYRKLLERMEQQGLTTYRIRKDRIISESSLQAIREGGAISTRTIEALCEALSCQPGDILEYTPDEPVQD